MQPALAEFGTSKNPLVLCSCQAASLFQRHWVEEGLAAESDGDPATTNQVPYLRNFDLLMPSDVYVIRPVLACKLRCLQLFMVPCVIL